MPGVLSQTSLSLLLAPEFPGSIAGSEQLGPEPLKPRAEVLHAINMLSPHVARMGPAFEAIAFQKHVKSMQYEFLRGGEGASYYRWQIQALRAAAKACAPSAIGQRSIPLTAESRRELLGEATLTGSKIKPFAHSTAMPGRLLASHPPIESETLLLLQTYLMN